MPPLQNLLNATLQINPLYRVKTVFLIKCQDKVLYFFVNFFCCLRVFSVLFS